MSRFFRYGWLLCAALCALRAAAHEPAAGAPPGPVTLVRGLGNHHHPVSTANPLAQRFFDQGLVYVYAFNHQEAVRSFEQAARLDRRLAMAYWGLALAWGPNYNAPVNESGRPHAQAAIARAQALMANASPREQAYIEALALRFPAVPNVDPQQDDRDYRDAMRTLAERDPADADAATLFADAAMVLRPWRLWEPDGKPADGTAEIVAALEAVLQRVPDHIGANHLYIHAVEGSPEPERALPSARRLETLAPAAGHLLHMSSHIYDRIGDYAGSARANVAAIAADRAYIRARGEAGPYGGYYTHNLHFLAVARTMQGRYRDAIDAADAFARQVALGVPDLPGVAGYLPAKALIDVRFGHWREALRLPRPPKNLAALRAVWHFARAMARAAQGAQTQAERERDRFAEAVAALPEGEMWGRNLAADMFRVAAGMIEGNLALVRGDRPAAIEFLRAAAMAEDALAFDEPAPWYVPAREPLGQALLEAGDAAAAEVVFAAELVRHPGSGRALFGLMLALRAQGKVSLAAAREFARAWRDADSAPFLGARMSGPSIGKRSMDPAAP